MSAEFWASIGVSVATAGAGVWAARSARRTPRQEKRDDFVAITTQQGAAIERLERRVQLREAEAERLQDQITGQAAAIRWLSDERDKLLALIRRTGTKLPPRRDIPEPARPYLNHIDV